MRRLAAILLLILSCSAVSAQEKTEELEAAKVWSHSRREDMKMPQMGLQRLDSTLLHRAPAFMGETDIIKVLQMMPGVQAPSEGSAGFSVRGGLVDQNLIMLDGAPMYNAGHFLGFLSMFNNDILRSVSLYKGDFPAQYGGRMSSVLETTTKDGDLHSFRGNASLGIVSSKIMVEGPIVRDRLSFCASARGSFFDVLFPMIRKIPPRSALHFYDANAKLTWVASDRDRLSLSAFMGGDKFGSSLEQYGMNVMDFRFRSQVASLRWSHAFSPRLHSNVTLYHSKSIFDLDCDYNFAIFDYQSFIRESGIRTGLTWISSDRNTLEAGVQLPLIRVNSGDCIPKGDNIAITEMHIAPNFAIQPSIYVQDKYDLGWMTVRAGLRLSEYTSMGPTDQNYYDPVTHRKTETRFFGYGKPIQTYWGLEPRLSVAVPAGADGSFKASYTRCFQYIQQAIVSTSGSPVDVWLPASPTIRPQISDQFSIGYDRLFMGNALRASVELFYKDNSNTLDFVENTGVIFDRPDRESFLRFGSSDTYGAEFMLSYDFRKLNGWIGYTYSHATYRIPEINGGRPYASPVNHDHSINLLLSYELGRRVSASMYWVFYSGAPTTYPVSRYPLGGSYAPIFTSRNEKRLPDYHRMDLSLSCKTRGRLENKRWSGEWTFSVYNAYSRHNVWSMVYSYSQHDDKPRAVKMYLFPILPSFAYNIIF